MAPGRPSFEGDPGPVGFPVIRVLFSLLLGTPTVCVSVWAVLRLYFDDTG